MKLERSLKLLYYELILRLYLIQGWGYSSIIQHLSNMCETLDLILITRENYVLSNDLSLNDVLLHRERVLLSLNLPCSVNIC